MDDIKLPRQFRGSGDIPIVRAPPPPKTGGQKFKEFFSPQVNAAIVGWLLTLVFSCLWGNQASKVSDLNGKIGTLTTEKTALENRIATYSAIPLQVPTIISNLAQLSASDPTNSQRIISMMFAVQSVTNMLADLLDMPEFSLEVNGVVLTQTNKPNVVLDKTRKLKFRITNLSRTTLDKVGMDVLVPVALDLTNVVYSGTWSPDVPYAISLTNNAPETVIGNHLSWQATKMIPSTSRYNVEELEVTTNYTGYATQLSVLLYSSKSKLHQYSFLVFRPNTQLP